MSSRWKTYSLDKLLSEALKTLASCKRSAGNMTTGNVAHDSVNLAGGIQNAIILAGRAKEVSGKFTALLDALPEFARSNRYGKACAVCNGHEEEAWGYVEKGPDRGHEKGCALRAALDARGASA